MDTPHELISYARALPRPLVFDPGPVSGPARNCVLRDLVEADRSRLLVLLQPVSLEVGEVLYDSGTRITHFYFPMTAVVSSLHTTETGATVEMGLVGNDGVVGVSLFLGADTTPHRTETVVRGQAYRMPAAALREEFARGGSLQRVLLRYTQSLITQISQMAICNRLHDVEQRLCRWLLMCHDRVTSNELLMTQELMSHMLGGRRESVTVAAGRLQERGLIRYARGRISIVNRRGLEASVCECYPIVAAGRRGAH
ncbi:MAG: Crp/Fnr family transcriptional regulator [Acidobacteriota bacterium]|nr:Crp/Fnr family transcriptional regulator [Acidobacteriota bacterium]